MGCAPWVLDPDTPHGGLYWLNRINAFETHHALAMAFRQKMGLDKDG